MEIVRSKSMVLFVLMLVGLFAVVTNKTSKFDETSKVNNKEVAINM